MDNQVTDAIYSGGVLKPLGSVTLRESERVRLTIERSGSSGQDRRKSLEKLRAGIEQMQFCSRGALPSRDELHDRV